MPRSHGRRASFARSARSGERGVGGDRGGTRGNVPCAEVGWRQAETEALRGRRDRSRHPMISHRRLPRPSIAPLRRGWALVERGHRRLGSGSPATRQADQGVAAGSRRLRSGLRPARAAGGAKMGEAMRAAVFEGRERIVLEERPLPSCGPTDAIVKVTLTTICGTDVHDRDHRDRPPPAPAAVDGRRRRAGSLSSRRTGQPGRRSVACAKRASGAIDHARGGRETPVDGCLDVGRSDCRRRRGRDHRLGETGRGRRPGSRAQYRRSFAPPTSRTPSAWWSARAAFRGCGPRCSAASRTRSSISAGDPCW